jgi:hypothetical protein
MKLNIVLRTCDKKSIQGDRVVPKDECVLVCVKSLVDSIKNCGADINLHIVDDDSSVRVREELKKIAPKASFDFLEPRDEKNLNSKQKSRYSVRVQYEYIHRLPNEDLVYLVEDDYLHYPDSVYRIIEAWEYFSQLFPRSTIGIFPQDFNQMYYHPQNMFNDTYVDKCMVLPGPDRYYRTTWFTHESFMVPVSLIKKYKEEFDKLDSIGTVTGAWEGNTISNVWQKPEVAMLMPLGTLAVHLGCHKDISFYAKWEELYKKLKEEKDDA